MSITIKSGSLSEFFDSVKQTARELDANQPLTPKHSIWIEADDFSRLAQAATHGIIALFA
jgi:hypothetical protein